MAKPSFLKKIKNIGQISLVEPSENLEKSYFELSEKFSLSGDLLLKNNFLESATSDIYYSMYHSLLALLFKCGIKSENHEASAFLLEYLFKRKDLLEILSYAKRERIDKQYYPKTKTPYKEVQNLAEKSKIFNLEIKKLTESLVQEEIEKIRKKFTEI